MVWWALGYAVASSIGLSIGAVAGLLLALPASGSGRTNLEAMGPWLPGVLLGAVLAVRGAWWDAAFRMAADLHDVFGAPVSGSMAAALAGLAAGSWASFMFHRRLFQSP